MPALREDGILKDGDPRKDFPFRREPIRGSDITRYAQFIRCSTCPATESFHVTGKGVSSQVGEQKFARLNWSLGRTRAHDRCPACVKRIALAPAPSAEVIPIQSITPIEEIAPMLTPAPKASDAPSPVASADPPRIASREDKRRIVGALDEAYLIDKKCYAKGHTDKTVAAKLAMPWKWVADLREDMYGPAGSEESYAMLEGMEGVREEYRVTEALIASTREAMRQDMAALERRYQGHLTTLQENADKLGRRMTKLDSDFQRVLTRL